MVAQRPAWSVRQPQRRPLASISRSCLLLRGLQAVVEVGHRGDHGRRLVAHRGGLAVDQGLGLGAVEAAAGDQCLQFGAGLAARHQRAALGLQRVGQRGQARLLRGIQVQLAGGAVDETLAQLHDVGLAHRATVVAVRAGGQPAQQCASGGQADEGAADPGLHGVLQRVC
jgi:hypothetical protein